MTWTPMKLTPVKILVLTFVCAIVATVVNGVYTGPRYGKRDSGETASRVLQRNSGVRNIQARSAGERRFYPGTRFGGKRPYWQPTQFQGPPDADDRSFGDLVVGGSLPLSSIPYDCVYIPFVGVRCTKPGEESPFYNNEAALQSVVSGGTSTNNNENGNSPAVTGIDP